MEEIYPVSIMEASIRLNIPRQLIHQAIRNNELLTHRVIGKKIARVILSEVVEWNNKRLGKPKLVEIKLINMIKENTPCLNCNGARFTYNRKKNTYIECSSCNSQNESLSA